MNSSSSSDNGDRAMLAHGPSVPLTGRKKERAGVRGDLPNLNPKKSRAETQASRVIAGGEGLFARLAANQQPGEEGNKASASHMYVHH